MRSYLAFGALTAASMFAMACSDRGSDAASHEEAVTTVENTSVKEQTIGNCWLYGTAAWVEGLHKAAMHEEIDLSEGYWTYWHWYEEISGGSIERGLPDAAAELRTGSYWGVGVELIRKYGWMAEEDFIPSDATGRAVRHDEALKKINESLASGVLKDPEARKDPLTLITELNRAWGLSPELADDIMTTFGPYRRDFTSSPRAEATLRVHAPEELVVLAGDGAHRTNLLQAVGEAKPGTQANEGLREGDEAWSEVPYTWFDSPEGRVRRKAILRNMQDTLNKRLPIPTSWSISSDAKDGTFRARPSTSSSIQGGHLSVTVDYEVTNVPEFDTLHVDDRITSKVALEASLHDDAIVTFFRIKNSWGTSDRWTEEELRQSGSLNIPDGGKAKGSYLPSKPGYNDLFLDYLDLKGNGDWKHLLRRVAMPNKLRFPIPAELGGTLPPP